MEETTPTLEEIQKTALLNYRTTKESNKHLRLISSVCSTCDYYSFDDQSELYGYIYDIAKEYLERVTKSEDFVPF